MRAEADLLDRFRVEMYEALVDTECKKSDLEKVDRAVRETLDVVGKHGLAALPDHLERQLDELAKRRRSPGRGAEENIPWWKLGAIILIVGVAIMNFIHCTFFGCTVTDWNGYIAGYTVLVLILLFC